MLSRRALGLSFLSLACIATFLYYTIIPSGPRLLQWKTPSASWTDEETDGVMANTTSAYEATVAADKFTPE